MSKYSTAKKKADRWFSLYIRLRDADAHGNCTCITCGKIKHWKQMHCGHFALRDKMQTRYHEKNCNTQCPGCNTFKAGKQYEHGRAIDQKYGEGTADFIMGISNRYQGYKAFELEQIAEDYKQRAKALAEEKGQDI